jgi:hypothetical protein
MEAGPFLWVVMTGAALIALSFALDHLWARTIPATFVYYIVRAPGVVVHECSHVLGCLMTGAHVRNVVLFSKGGGSVTYSRPAVPYLGDVIISTAPTVVIPLVLAGTSWVFVTCFGCDIPLEPAFIISAGDIMDMARTTAGIFTANLWYRFNPWFLLYLYLAVSLVLSLAPSVQDMKNAAAGIVIIVLVFLLLFMSGYPSVIAVLSGIARIAGTGISIGLAFGLIAAAASLPLLAVLFFKRP